MSETAAKKDVQKLQRVIVDALEDVKAQDIQVFNTEHLSPLFERVIIASGTSNRQTKALSASVRDKVREAGFGKPRIEGEDNGEWIIADCGQAVVHIMQPVIRQYYNLEEIWGDKPVRLKLGAPKPPAKPAKVDKKPAPRSAAGKTLTPQEAAKANRKATAPAGKTAAKTALKAGAKIAGTSGRAPAAASKTALKAPTRQAAAKPKSVPVKKLVVNAPGKAAAKSGAPSGAKAAAKPVVSKSAPTSRPAARKKTG